MCTPKGNTQRKSEGDNQNDEHGKRQDPDVWGRNRDEQHYSQGSGKAGSRVLRNRQIRGHCHTERLLHLERLDGGRQRVHIHFGAKSHTPQTLRNLANIMASHESLIAEALDLDHGRMNRYCKTVDPKFLEVLNKKKPDTMAGFADIWYGTQDADYGRNHHYNSSRYRMLNYHATFTKGTVEFRLFEFEAPADGKQNGLHAGRLKAYMQNIVR